MAASRRGRPFDARPTLGVITGLIRPTMSKQKPFGNQTYRFKALCREAGRFGLTAFIFLPEGLDTNSRSIQGWTYSAKSRRWVRRRFRFPDAVYNRIPTRKLEIDQRVRAALEAIEREGIPLFNTRYLNKFEVYKVARARSSIAPHVPDTRPLRAVKDLEEMLSRYKTVYLKKSGGTLGNGISVVRQAGNDIVFSKNNTRCGIQEKRLKKKQLRGVIAKYLRHKSYLVQQGVDLVKYKGRPFDFRVMVQKRSDGRWHLTGAGTRVAGPRQITTHVPRGGSRLSFRQGMTYASGRDKKAVARVVSQIRKLCCETASAVEQSLGLHLAEASFDVGVDTSRRTWLIEMNSKPFLFDEKDIQTKARRYLLEYARHVIYQRRNSKRPAEV